MTLQRGPSAAKVTRTAWAKPLRLAVSLLAICVGLFAIGLCVGTLVSPPRYAVVFVDDEARVYIAPQCVDAWRKQPNKDFGLMRRADIGEANDKKYKPEYECAQTGAFSQDGPSASALLLRKIGVLPVRKYWWDMPYRTEDGVVYPGENSTKR